MRPVLLFLLISFTFFGVNAQSFKKAKPYYILKYDPSSSGGSFKKAHIKSPFASERLSKKALPRDFSKGKVVAIDYYYTQFREAKSFQQIGLDEKRFKELKKMFPHVYNQIDSVPVRFIEQTLAKTIPEAKYFFHGFVLYYQVPMGNAPNVRRKEIALIKKLFKNNFELDDSPKFGEIRKISGTQPRDFLNVWGKTIHLSKPDSVIEVNVDDVMSGVMKASQNEFVTCYQEGEKLDNNKMKVKLFTVPKNHFPGSGPPPFTEGMFGLMKKSYEESKLRALSARKQQFPNEVSGDLYKSLQSYEGDSIVLVIDITGSMVESIAHVLKWLHQSDIKPKIKGIALFNDGDRKRDKNKKIGKTGGIYFVKDINKLEKALIHAIGKGTGGDLPENDIEALLAAKAEFGSGNFILVADNLAHPRDLPLLIDVDFQVDLLMCNAMETKSYYLDIASKTGGTIINKK